MKTVSEIARRQALEALGELVDKIKPEIFEFADKQFSLCQFDPGVIEHMAERFDLNFWIFQGVCGPIPEKMRSFLESLSRDFDDFVSFAHAFHWMRSRLEMPHQRSRLDGQLKSGFTGQRQGLLPLAFELQTIELLTFEGWRVGFNDKAAPQGAKGRRFDFLAVKGNKEIEIECKSIDTDAGTGIGYEKALIAANHAASILERHPLVPSEEQVGILKIKLLRPYNDKDDLDGDIETALQAVIDNKSVPAICNNLVVDWSVTQFAPIKAASEEGSPDPRKNPALGAVAKDLGLWDARRVRQSYDSNDRIIFVALVPPLGTHISANVARKLRDDGLSQFTGTRPGRIHCVITGFDATAILSAAAPESFSHADRTISIKYICDTLFGDGALTHIEEVSFIGGRRSRVWNPEKINSPRTYFDQAHVISVKNSNFVLLKGPGEESLVELHDPDWTSFGPYS